MPSLSFRDYSLGPLDLIDMSHDDQDDQLLREYKRLAKTLNPLHLLDCILSDLDGEESPLLPYIKEIMQHPSDPNYPTTSKTDEQRVGKMVLALAEKAVANGVNLKLVVGED